MIEHEEARLHLADLVLPTLADPLRIAGVRGHVAVCSECQAELEDLRGIDVRIHGTGPAPIPPADLTARVLAVAGARQETSGRALRARRLWRDVTAWRIAAATTVLAATILGVLLATAGSGEHGFTATDSRRFVANPGWEATGHVDYGTRDGRDAIRVHVANLPALASGYYELWMARSVTERLSLGEYDAAPAGTLDVTVDVPGADDQYRGVWITREPMDNDPAWTDDWVVKASFAAPLT